MRKAECKGAPSPHIPYAASRLNPDAAQGGIALRTHLKNSVTSEGFTFGKQRVTQSMQIHAKF